MKNMKMKKKKKKKKKKEKEKEKEKKKKKKKKTEVKKRLNFKQNLILSRRVSSRQHPEDWRLWLLRRLRTITN